MTTRGGIFALVVNSQGNNNNWHPFYSTLHKNFGHDLFDTFLKSDMDFGSKINDTIPLFGDILHSLTVNITLPEIKTKGGKFRWKPNIGQKILSSVHLFFNGNKEEPYSQFGEFYNIWDQFTLSKEQQKKHNELIGQQNPQKIIDNDGVITKKLSGLQTFKDHHPETKLIIPLRFKFKNVVSQASQNGKDNGNDLRDGDLKGNDDFNKYVDGLPGGNNSIEINLERFENLYEIDNAHVIINNGSEVKIPNYSMVLDWIFLDPGDRDKLYQSPRFYVINNVQRIEFMVQNENKRLDLIGFKGRIKELIWTIEEKYSYDYWIRMKGIYDILTRHTNKFISDIVMDYYYNETSNENPELRSIFTDDWESFFNEMINQTRTKDYLRSAEITGHGVPIQQRMTADYYQTFQPYYHHTYLPKDENIYIHSFASRPENIDSSGFFNASRLNNMELNLELDGISSSNPGIVKIYALTQDLLISRNGQISFYNN